MTDVGELSFDHEPDEKEIAIAEKQILAAVEIKKPTASEPVTLTVAVAVDYLENEYARFLDSKKPAKTADEIKLSALFKPRDGK